MTTTAAGQQSVEPYRGSGQDRPANSPAARRGRRPKSPLGKVLFWLSFVPAVYFATEGPTRLSVIPFLMVSAIWLIVGGRWLSNLFDHQAPGTRIGRAVHHPLPWVFLGLGALSILSGGIAGPAFTLSRNALAETAEELFTANEAPCAGQQIVGAMLVDVQQCTGTTVRFETGNWDWPNQVAIFNGGGTSRGYLYSRTPLLYQSGAENAVYQNTRIASSRCKTKLLDPHFVRYECPVPNSD